MPLLPRQISPATTSGLLGPGVDVDQTPVRDLSKLGQLPGQMARGLLDAAQVPGDVFAGRRPANVENAMALAGLAGGGGLLAPRVPSSLGVFGGKMRAAEGPPRFMEIDVDKGLIGQKIKLPSGAEGNFVSRVKRNKNTPGSVDLDLNFAVRDTRTGVLGGTPAGLSKKDGRAFFTAAMNEARRHIELVRPRVVTFSAARPELAPIYRRLVKQIVRETGGLSVPQKRPNSFKITLPNPRIFEATGKGLLDTP